MPAQRAHADKRVGLEPERYAGDLENAEGWDDEDDDKEEDED